MGIFRLKTKTIKTHQTNLRRHNERNLAVGGDVQNRTVHINLHNL